MCLDHLGREREADAATGPARALVRAGTPERDEQAVFVLGREPVALVDDARDAPPVRIDERTAIRLSGGACFTALVRMFVKICVSRTRSPSTTAGTYISVHATGTSTLDARRSATAARRTSPRSIGVRSSSSSPASAWARVRKSSTSVESCSTRRSNLSASPLAGSITPSASPCSRPFRIVSGVRSSCAMPAVRTVRSRSYASISAAIRLKLAMSSPVSPDPPRGSTRTDRSPAETCAAARATAVIGRLIRRATTVAMPPPRRGLKSDQSRR